MNELRVGDILRVSIDTYKAKWKTILMFLVSTLISLPGIFIAPFTVLISVLAMRKLESLKAEVEVI